MTEGSQTVQRRRRLRREFNPLLIKELRGRMRGARAFVVLTVYLLLLSCITSVIYYGYSATAVGPGGGPEDMAYLGKAIFASVVLIEILMVTAIAPSFTTGAISGERERKTYELLRTTLLPARKLISGKLTSALALTVLLILAAVPLESLAFVLGGVVVEEVVLALVILLVTALAFASFGLFYSSLARSTRVSTTLTYVTTLLAVIGLPVLLVLLTIALDALAYSSPSSHSWIERALARWAVEAALTYGIYLTAGLSPITAAVFTQMTLEEEGTIGFFWLDIDSTHRILIPSAWIVYTVAYLVLTLVLLLLAVARVRQQEKR